MKACALSGSFREAGWWSWEIDRSSGTATPVITVITRCLSLRPGNGRHRTPVTSVITPRHTVTDLSIMCQDCSLSAQQTRPLCISIAGARKITPRYLNGNEHLFSPQPQWWFLLTLKALSYFCRSHRDQRVYCRPLYL